MTVKYKTIYSLLLWALLVSTRTTRAQQAAVDQCNNCALTGGRFACLSEITYAFCFNADQPDASTIRDCPAGFYCNIEYIGVCTTIETTTPSCKMDGVVTTTTITTTTHPSPTSVAAIDPTIFCAELKQQGNFKVENDPTCKEYIMCYKLSGQYLGLNYMCENYFNAATGKCQSVRPDDCN